MSFRVLVIPEDPLHNGHILKPLTEAILADAGKARAPVRGLASPRLRGYDHALRAIRRELPGRYAHFARSLFFSDADRASEDAMRRLESDLMELGVPWLCCPAEPEVEIYACAAFRDELPKLKVSWEEIRPDPSVRLKEETFRPMLEKYGGPGQRGLARERMTRASLRNLPRLFRLCPELKRLRDRIATRLAAE